jgi:glycosyltransferase involved in cell wall biosynthesis
MGLKIPLVHLPSFVTVSEAAAPASERPLVEDLGRRFFVFVGRLEKPKGTQTLIPVLRRYTKGQLLIAGAGSYEPRLRQLAERSGNIGFLGYLSQEQPQALYRQAVALIVPSVFFEVFGQSSSRFSDSKRLQLSGTLGGARAYRREWWRIRL